MSIDFDFTELNTLSADLGKVAGNTGPFINSAVQFTSNLIKEAAQKSVGGGDPRWKALPSAIDYEVTTFQGFGASVIQSDIGYDKSKDAGKLGNVREYGTPRVPPHLDLQTALTENEADFEKGLRDAIDDALKEGGL